MTEIIISGPNGERRVFEGETFVLQPGEKVVGLDKSGAGHISGLGDIVEKLARPVAILLGKQGCSACAARKEILNIWRKLGAKNVAELLKMTLTHTPEQVAEEIKVRLNDSNI